MKYILLALLFSLPAHAFEMFTLQRVDIDYKAYAAGGHDPIIQDSGLQNREANKYVSLSVDTTVLHYFFFRSLVHGTSDQPIVGEGSGQFRTVGWQYQLGLYVTDFLTVQYEHHSQHLLDYSGINHFPVENSFGFTLKLYESKTDHGRIW